MEIGIVICSHNFPEDLYLIRNDFALIALATIQKEQKEMKKERNASHGMTGFVNLRTFEFALLRGGCVIYERCGT